MRFREVPILEGWATFREIREFLRTAPQLQKGRLHANFRFPPTPVDPTHRRNVRFQAQSCRFLTLLVDRPFPAQMGSLPAPPPTTRSFNQLGSVFARGIRTQGRPEGPPPGGGAFHASLTSNPSRASLRQAINGRSAHRGEDTSVAARALVVRDAPRPRRLSQ